MNFTEKTISSKNIFKGKVISVRLDEVELPDGQISTREVVDHPGGVCIAALTEKNDLLFVRQYRYAYEDVLLELPAGKLERGRSPLENGIRELKEETGAVGFDYKSLGEIYPATGYCGEIVHLYLCKVKDIGESSPDQDEFIQSERIHIEKAVDMVLKNEIKDAKTQIAVLKTYLFIKNHTLSIISDITR